MNPVMATYGALGLAIISEISGTRFLQKSEQFTRLVPTVISGLCHLAAVIGLGFIVAGVLIVNIVMSTLSH